MTDTPSRLFGLLLVLVGVWVVTYWLYEPSGPRVTADLRHDPLAAVQPVAPPAPPRQTPPAQTPQVDVPPRADLLPLPEPDAGASAAPVTRRVQKVVPPEFREYIVQRGDVSWEAIAGRKEVYGDRSRWQAVSRANPFASPNRLKVGLTKLKIAVDPENIQGKTVWVDETIGGGSATVAVVPEPTKPETVASKVADEVMYTIAEDDTLWSISKKMYGQGAQWKRIYDANKSVIKDPDRPPKGAKIRIPPPETAHAGD